MKGFKKEIDSNSGFLKCLNDYLESKSLLASQTSLTPPVTAYLIVSWILVARNESHGFGFPFDRQHFDFYLRLQEAYPDLQNLKQAMTGDASLLLLTPISKTLADKALANTVLRMQEKNQDI